MKSQALHKLGLRTLASLVIWLAAGAANAHQVPSLGLDLEIINASTCRLKLDIDPRLFLSDKPATLPPVEAAWYRDLSPAKLDAAEASAAEFIRSRLVFKLGEVSINPTWKFLAMDPSGNQPLSATSKEIHLLADATAAIPAGVSTFQLSLDPNSSAALTMLTTIDGEAQRRPQVIFPGEQSRPITWTAAPTPPATAEQGYVWYHAPFAHGFWHPLSLHGGWSHLVFALCLVISAARFAPTVARLFAFHVLHFVITLTLSRPNYVWPQEAWLWPTLTLALLAIKRFNMVGVVSVLPILAALHSLNEWPHAATPSVIGVLELGFAAGNAVIVVPAAGLAIMIRTIWAQKKTAV